jgi:hypothetical protein
MVTQPGPVTIYIQTTGAPVVATMQGVLPRAAEQGGTGTLHLAYQVSPQDLQVGALWTVRMVWYTFAVRIVGPKGVPDGVARP